jgi:hypothetical protein
MSNQIAANSVKLNVISQGDELVVDSRLIANRLGLQHESLTKTIKKYATRFQAMGNLRFEIGTSTNSVGATHQTSFCYLNEKQCNMLIGLSKNTDLVVDALEAKEEGAIAQTQIFPANNQNTVNKFTRGNSNA